jgi:hypothetical protein
MFQYNLAIIDYIASRDVNNRRKQTCIKVKRQLLCPVHTGNRYRYAINPLKLSELLV